MTHIRLTDVAHFGNVALARTGAGIRRDARTRALGPTRAAPQAEAQESHAPAVATTPTDKMLRTRHRRGRG